MHVAIPSFADIATCRTNAFGVAETRARGRAGSRRVEPARDEVLLEQLEVVRELAAHFLLDRWLPEASAKLTREASETGHGSLVRQVGSSRIRVTPSANRVHCAVSTASRSRPASVRR